MAFRLDQYHRATKNPVSVEGRRGILVTYEVLNNTATGFDTYVHIVPQLLPNSLFTEL